MVGDGDDRLRGPREGRSHRAPDRGRGQVLVSAHHERGAPRRVATAAISRRGRCSRGSRRGGSAWRPARAPGRRRRAAPGRPESGPGGAAGWRRRPGGAAGRRPRGRRRPPSGPAGGHATQTSWASRRPASTRISDTSAPLQALVWLANRILIEPALRRTVHLTSGRTRSPPLGRRRPAAPQTTAPRGRSAVRRGCGPRPGSSPSRSRVAPSGGAPRPHCSSRPRRRRSRSRPRRACRRGGRTRRVPARRRPSGRGCGPAAPAPPQAGRCRGRECVGGPGRPGSSPPTSGEVRLGEQITTSPPGRTTLTSSSRNARGSATCSITLSAPAAAKEGPPGRSVPRAKSATKKPSPSGRKRADVSVPSASNPGLAQHVRARSRRRSPRRAPGHPAAPSGGSRTGTARRSPRPARRASRGTRRSPGSSRSGPTQGSATLPPRYPPQIRGREAAAARRATAATGLGPGPRRRSTGGPRDHRRRRRRHRA